MARATVVDSDEAAALTHPQSWVEGHRSFKMATASVAHHLAQAAAVLWDADPVKHVQAREDAQQKVEGATAKLAQVKADLTNEYNSHWGLTK
jgi:hypothetical protein